MDEQCRQTVSDYNNYLDKMGQAIQHFCEDLADSDYAEISMALPAIIEGLGWINDAGNEFKELGELAADRVTQFQQLIARLAEALENKDYVLLHDLFIYEMLPLLEQLKISEIKN